MSERIVHVFAQQGDVLWYRKGSIVDEHRFYPACRIHVRRVDIYPRVRTLYGGTYISGQYKGNSVPTINESLYNHMLVFAAEESRKQSAVVNIDEYIKSIN